MRRGEMRCLVIVIAALGMSLVGAGCSDGSPPAPEAHRSSTTSTSAPAEGCAGRKGEKPPEQMFARLCERRAAVEDIEEVLGLPVPTLAVAVDTQQHLCASGFEPPTEDQVQVQYAAYIRGRAQQDEELGRRWLEAGILTRYSRKEGEAGTFTIDLDFNSKVLDRLSAADLEVLEDVRTERETYCPAGR